MCGRFTLSLTEAELAEWFELRELPDLADLFGRRVRYNISPTEPVAVVLEDPKRPVARENAGKGPASERRASGAGVAQTQRRRLVSMRWGLAQSFSSGRPLFNARSEKLGTGFWSESFRMRRCLVPVSSFYEWQDVGTAKRRPHEIEFLGDGPIAFAGIWMTDLNRQTGETQDWCSVITTDACELMRGIHNAGKNRYRQPAFVDRADFDGWLASDLDPDLAERVLSVRPSAQFRCRALLRIGADPVGSESMPPVAAESGVQQLDQAGGEQSANRGKQKKSRGRITSAKSQPGLPFDPA